LAVRIRHPYTPRPSACAISVSSAIPEAPGTVSGVASKVELTGNGLIVGHFPEGVAVENAIGTLRTACPPDRRPLDVCEDDGEAVVGRTDWFYPDTIATDLHTGSCSSKFDRTQWIVRTAAVNRRVAGSARRSFVGGGFESSLRSQLIKPCWTMSATGDWSRAARRSTAPLLCRGRLAGAHEGSHDPAIDSLTSSIALARDDAPTLSNQTVSK
jgi:hypothetical protein